MSQQIHGALSIRKLEKQIGHFRLQADFTIAQGERAGLIGRSGCGKTSLLRAISGLDPWVNGLDLGEIWVGEREITCLPPERRGVGLVFQEQALFPSLSVLENAAFGLRMLKVPKEQRRAEALQWLERVGMQNHAHSGIDRLSGGERQRVAFVRALLPRPRVLLLDEPFSALDPEMRAVLRRELVELHQLWPVPLVLVTHDPSDLASVATVSLSIREENAGKFRRVERT